jgi:DNA polymerase (family X)
MGRYIDVANHLTLIAQLRSLDGESNSFQIKAYEGAARTFRDLDYAESTGQPVPDWRTLKNAGIGASVRTTVEQFLAIGSSDKYDELASYLPAEAMSMTVVQGIGPKKAYRLWMEGIHNFAELSAKAYNGELNPAMTESVLQASKQQGRVPYSIASQVAEGVLAQVLEVPGVLRATICGSIRRHTPTSKDIDIALSLDPGFPRAPMLETFSHLGAGFQGGDRKASMVIKGDPDMRCDLWLGEPYYYGSLLNHCTGSKEHNIALRTLAASRGLTISEYGIFRGDERLGGEEEHDIYNVLHIPYVEPENRNK